MFAFATSSAFPPSILNILNISISEDNDDDDDDDGNAVPAAATNNSTITPKKKKNNNNNKDGRFIRSHLPYC